MDDALKSLQFALDKYPERVELVPVEQLLVDSARQNEKRHAYIKLAVPDELVKSVRGKLKDRDVVGEQPAPRGSAAHRQCFAVPPTGQP